MEDEIEYDLNKIYDYKELPDKISGRCDNCNQASFTSRAGGGLFIRECNNCGMKRAYKTQKP